uniref:SXP/RAL-2 family protein Ani s 5-like cation-binding domain-containing protein n=2 Tax=Acrobeloides nanus TaxID=290746 RepID=A0A914D9Y2_9BILA
MWTKMFLSLIIFVFSVIISALARPSVDWKPPFLVKAPETVVDSFDSLIANAGELTDEEIEDSVERWIRRQSYAIQANYEKFKHDREYYEAVAAAQKQKMIQRLSPMARNAYAQIHSIYTHPTLIANDKMMIIEKIMNTLPDDVKSEIPL